jgi:hypothetical protein
MKYVAIMMYGVVNLQLHAFLTSGKWSASRSRRFILVSLDRMLGGFRVGLHTVENNKTLHHSRKA